MGQENSQPLVPCASTQFPVSAPVETLQTPSLVRDRTEIIARTNERVNTMDRSSDDTTMDPSRDDSSPRGPYTNSSDTDLAAEAEERHDSISDVDFDSDDEIRDANDIDKDDENDYPILADLDTSDSTHQLLDTFEQEHSFYKRELRPAREAKRTAPNTWIDADISGDFDPREEARQARLRRKRTKHKHPQRKKIDWGEEEDISEPGAVFGSVLQLPKPLLCLTFSSTSAKAAFSELCSKFQDKVRLTRDDFTGGYQLRRRDGAGHGGFVDDAFANVTGAHVLASEEPSDPSNQPFARGCLSCASMGARCSLLDNEHSWPCNECEEAEFDCQLVQEPELKLACTHCQYLGKKLKWLVCSFDYDHDPAHHRGRCEQCQTDGHQACVAGPRPGQTRTRIRIGSDGAPYTNDEPVVSQKIHRVRTCRQCLDSRRVCSFAASSQQDAGDVCTACDMSGKTCEPLGREAPRTRHALQTSAMESATDIPKDSGPNERPIEISSSPPRYDPDQWETLLATPSSPPHTPYSSIDSLSAPPADPTLDTGGTIRTVRTKFCHPVHFGHQDQTLDGSDPCHFCSCKHFGIIGLEERTTEVIEWYDGRGWEEIDGGHKSDNVKGTRMCTRCTMERMQIMVCPDHALRRIGEPGTMANLKAAFERLFLREPAVADQWCTVCCKLAVWECCVAQEVRAGEGCGLALCEACIVDLERCGGSFEAMLQALDPEQSEARPAGLRADHEFLKENGLLMRYLKWSAKS